jgi:transcriptional regulator with XRE-family HTH domain
MSNRGNVSSSLSARIVRFLVDKGHSQADIARMLNVSEGFISLVKSKDRSFTLDHLELLSEAISVPLGALLIAVTEPVAGAKYDRKLFELSARILKQADRAHGAILRGSTTPSR